MESNWAGVDIKELQNKQNAIIWLMNKKLIPTFQTSSAKCWAKVYYFCFGQQLAKAKYDKIQKVLRSSKTFLLIFPITNQGVHCLKVSKRKGGGVHQLWCLTTENQRERIISVRLVTRLKEKFNVIAQGLMMMNR